MVKSFVETLMDHIMEAMMIPKAQIERVVGPILSMFLEDVLTETLRKDPALSGQLVMICPEFPLKKPDNRQSTNIDWLMYNTERRQLLFVELKTSDTSINIEQNEIYRAKQKAVQSKGGSFLIEDLEQLKSASKEFGKYQYILEKKVLPYKNEISACHDVRIIYLVPKSAEHKVQGHADRVLTFGILSKSITGSFAEEWRIIQSRLCKLDDSSQRSRNRQSAPPSETNLRVNFADRCDFRSIVELCKKRGDAVIVGFMGGENALANRDITSLKTRNYKWDNAVGGTGVKDLRNWIHGSKFSRIIDIKIVNPRLSSNDVKSAMPRRSSNWEGTLKFQDMFDFCLKHGDDIVVGFTGGKEAFVRITLSGLQQRSHYKWDFAKNMAGKKRSDWLPGTSVIEMLKHHHGYSSNQR